MTAWVLLRGLVREARHWGEFPMHFQIVMGAQQIVTLDFPGNGSLHALPSEMSVAEMANHCRMQLKLLGNTPPYRVLALSLGAMVAVEWSAQHPEEIEKLVLINTSLAPYNPFYHRLRPSNYFTLLGVLLFGSAMQRESLILRLTSTRCRKALQQETLLKQWVAFACEYPVTRSNALRQLRAAINYRAAPTKPPVPTLLLAGQQDRLVNVQCSITLAQCWGCPIRLHPTAGHDLPLDDGIWVAQQILQWEES